MDFTYSENQNMLAESIDRFLTSRYDLPTRKGLLSDAAGTQVLWQEMAELGWIGAAFPESQGGFAESALDSFVVMEGLGRHLVTLPYLTSTFTYPQPDRFLGISDSRGEKFATFRVDWNSLAHQQERTRRSLRILRLGGELQRCHFQQS